MRHFLAVTGLLLLGAQQAAANNLMSCDVIGTRTNGENTEIIYNTASCRPVVTAEVVGTETSGNSTRNVYGAATQPALGGGPIYIMRFVDQNQGPVIHYGPPLDGNPGTAGR
jgi:hypothetical protein